jgi:ribosome-interacting GTPase 1
MLKTYNKPLFNVLLYSEFSKILLLKGEGFDVMKSGDARVALIGFPSVGKVSSKIFMS